MRLLRFFSGFYLGPLLFNIYICDFFFEKSDIDNSNYADDNTSYACVLLKFDIESVIFKLQKSTERIFKWFRNNNLTSNAEKSQLIVSSKENLEIQSQATL